MKKVNRLDHNKAKKMLEYGLKSEYDIATCKTIMDAYQNDMEVTNNKYFAFQEIEMQQMQQ